MPKTSHRIAAAMGEVVGVTRRMFGVESGPEKYRDLVIAAADGSAEFSEASGEELHDILLGRTAERFKADVTTLRQRRAAAQALAVDVPEQRRREREAMAAKEEAARELEAAEFVLIAARNKHWELMNKAMLLHSQRSSTEAQATNLLRRTYDRSIDDEIEAWQADLPALEKTAQKRQQIETALGAAKDEVNRLELHIESLKGATLPEQQTDLVVYRATRVSMKARIKDLSGELAGVEKAEAKIAQIEQKITAIDAKKLIPENVQIEWQHTA